MIKSSILKQLLNAAVIVSALGYFVDVFDLLLFNVVRIKSLSALGFSNQALTDAGIALQNWQMAGMILGGIGSGILGDKLGRVKALYFSIALYSIANIANGWVYSFEVYALCRFLAGVGLAGELGAGVTLVSESLPKEIRGLGTMLFAACGMSGAVVAGSVDYFVSDWRLAFFLGGGLGLILLILRLNVGESSVFKKITAQKLIQRGNFFHLFSPPERFGRFIKSALLGVTTWFNTGILLLLAPEFSILKGIKEPVLAGTAVVWFHVGSVTGDILSGLLSQYWCSRLKAMRFFLLLQVIFIAAYLYAPLSNPSQMYGLILLLGVSVGFWAVFITNASEQFGTNIRATAASAIPTVVRGLLIPMSMSFKWLKSPTILNSAISAAAVVGVVCLVLAFWSSFSLKETFDKDLDFVE